MVRLTVRAHQAAAIHAQHYVQLLQRHILHQHIVATLQEAVIHGEHRGQALLGHAAGHRHRVALGNAYVEKPPGEHTGEAGQSRAFSHGGGDGAHALILPGQRCQRLAEHGGKRLPRRFFLPPGRRVKRPYAVKPLRLALRRLVAAALHRVNVYQHGPFFLPRCLQYGGEPPHIVAVHRPHIGKPHVLEHGAHRRQQRLFQRRLYLVAQSVQRAAARQPRQRLPVLSFELIILRRGTHPGQMPGQPAHIGVDRHAVVIQHHDEPLTAAAGVVQPLKAEAAAQRAVADHRQHVVVLSQQRPRPGHAQRHGHGVRRVARHKGVVLALVGLGKARQSAELPQRAEQLPPPGQRLVDIALVSHVEHQPVTGGVKHPVDGHGQLHRP